MYKLELRDGIDSINFVNDTESTFYLMDETFVMALPEVKEVTAEYTAAWSPAINSRSYGPREVTFRASIRGASRSAVIASANRLFRMAARSLTDKHLGGGAFAASYSFEGSENSVVSGAQGIQLVVQIGDSDSGDVDGEYGYEYESSNNTYFYVLSMDVILESPVTSMSITYNGAEYSMNDVSIMLKCSSFGYGDPVNVELVPSPSANGYSGQPEPFFMGSIGARVVIPSSSIPGSGEALTRFTMNVDTGPLGSGNGIIIARDSGRSLINCPSAFFDSVTQEQIGTGFIVPYGYDEGAINQYDVEFIAVNPVQVRYRKNSGAWSSTVTPAANVGIDVTVGKFGFFFTSTNVSSIFSVGDVITSISTAYYAPSFVSVTIASVLDRLVQENGYTLKEHSIVVPNGVHGRYKVMYAVVGTTDIEYRAAFRYIYQNEVARSYYGKWTKQVNGIGMLDCGIIDTTPRGMPHSVHPGGHSIIQIVMYARSISGVSSSGSLYSGGMYFVPCDDDRSYIRVQWDPGDTWVGYQAISNFDPRHPYVAMVMNDYRSAYDPDSILAASVSIDETHEGSPITLVPGVTNTVLMIPLFSSWVDFRTGYPTEIGTGNTTLAIRPAHILAN